MELVVKDLCYRYGDGPMILNNINLTFEGSKLYCIIGPNGVGKSTLVKCMNKLLKPVSGDVLIDEKSISDYSFKDLAQFMSFIPVSQGYSFRMTVMDVVLLGRYDPKKWRTDEEDLDIVHRSLKLMDMEDYSMRDINGLSAGQCQKVNLCKGLVQEPKIMILDEPTSNLDVKHQMYVTELLKAISRESDMMVIMISPDLNIAAQFADEIIMMSEPGVVYKDGRPEEVISAESISKVYGVDCEVITHLGKPHVLLNSALSKRQMNEMAKRDVETVN
ncbi:MAG: ABC transporter ATP-binding protein [Candidatus Methanomethylophilaceae archaeon]